MSLPIDLFVGINPAVKGNYKRAWIRGGRAIIAPDPKTIQNERTLVAALATHPSRPSAPLDQPIRVDVEIRLAVPAGFSGKKRAAALGEPDMDPDDSAPRVAELVARVEAEREQVRQDVIDLQEVVRLQRFAHRVQRAFATHGCENEPLQVAHLGLLAERVADIANRLDDAHTVIRNVAAALGDPEQDHEDLPASVEALRLQRDHLRDAAKAALSEVIRG